MTPTHEEKQRIKEILVYDAAEGTLKWTNNLCSAESTNAAFQANSKGPETKYDLVVEILGNRYVAADICWFLNSRQWPTHGVVMRDKSAAGRIDLRLSNLRRRRKPEYVKKGRAVWVPRQMIEDLIGSLRFHGFHLDAASILEELLAKETKR